MSDGNERTGERLQKILARAGVVPSRRKAEELIGEGRVTINGQVAGLGDRAEVAKDSIKVDGKRVAISTTRTYLLLNKPKGVLTTVEDPEGRPTVMALIPPQFRKALVPVGRLDFMTEGLLILTDDGDFAQRLAHPRYGCHKTYAVKVSGDPDERELDKLRQGVVMEGHKTSPSRIERTKPPGGPREGENTWFQVELAEGRSRQIREMFERIGHPVQKLRRVAIGPVRDADLPVGSVRELSEDEVEKLRRATARPKTKEETARSLAPRTAPRAAPSAKAVAKPERVSPSGDAVEVRAVPAKRRASVGGKLVTTRFTEVRKWRDSEPPAPSRAPEERFREGARESPAERPARRPPTRSAGRPSPRTPERFTDRPSSARPSPRSEGRPSKRPERPAGPRPSRPPSDRPPSTRPPGSRPSFSRGVGSRPSTGRPPSSRPPSDRPFRPAGVRPAGVRPAGVRTGAPRPLGARPMGTRPGGSRPAGARPSGPRPFGARPADARPSGTRPAGARPSGARPAGARPAGARPGGARPGGARPAGARPAGARPGGARPGGARPGGARPGGARPGGARPGGARPGGARPGGARPGGARPSGTRPGGRPAGSSRPRTGPPTSGPRRPRS